MWADALARTYADGSPVRQNQLAVDPELHSHSPRRRGNGKHECDSTCPSMNPSNGRLMPPPPVPINGSAFRSRTWETHPMGGLPDPFISDRRSRNKTDDSDVSMPDFQPTPAPPPTYEASGRPPSYHELAGANYGPLGRPRAPALTPYDQPFDQYVSVTEGQLRGGHLPLSGVHPPANTRNNSAANSPPGAAMMTAADGIMGLSSTAFAQQNELAHQRAISAFYLNTPRSEYEASFRTPSSTVGADREALRGITFGSRSHDMTGSCTETPKSSELIAASSSHDSAVPQPSKSSSTLLSSLRPPSSGNLSTSARTGNPVQDSKTSTPVLPAAPTPPRRASSEAKRKRASGAGIEQSSRGPSPRKVSRTEASGREAIASATVEAEDDEVRVVDGGTGRGKGRRAPLAQMDNPIP